MFFRKKDAEKKDPVAKKGIRKIDAIVTGAILSGIVGSLYGVKKIKDAKKKKDEWNIDAVKSNHEK